MTHHEKVGFWRNYIFSTDHKVIGIQYGLTALLLPVLWFHADGADALAVGLSRTSRFRWWARCWKRSLGCEMAAGGRDAAGSVQFFGAMHGTIMVFLAIVPLAFAAFGNYVVPLQIGAADMAFPRVNMASFQCFFLGGVMMFSSFLFRAGRHRSGWTSYSPLATVADMAHRFNGQTFWILGDGAPDHFLAAWRG